MYCQLCQMGGEAERLGRFGKKMSRHQSGNTMLNKRQEIFLNAIDGRLRVQDRAREILQDQIIEEVKELEHTETEEALQLVSRERDLRMYRNEKGKTKRLQGARKPRKDEEMAWAPPRIQSDWPSWEEATKMEDSEWRLGPEGGAEVPEIIIVSDAVEGTFVDLDGESRREQVEAKLSRRGKEILNGGDEIKKFKKESHSGGIRNEQAVERTFVRAR